jgi:hypothetical protein
VIAILVTFAVIWIVLKFLFPEGVPHLEELAVSRSPEELFAERRSGVVLEVEGVVEGVLPDSTRLDAERASQRIRFRTHSGHPLTILHDPSATGRIRAAYQDTIAVRGTYHWSLQGGLLVTGGSPSGEGPAGWIREAGELR